MVRAAWYQGSSRQNRIVPNLDAFWRAGECPIKTVYDRQKFMRHNMGLCRMGGRGWGGGRGGGSNSQAVRVAWG